MKDKSGASLKQKLSPSSIPNKDLLPLDQNQPLEKKKGDHVQEMTVRELQFQWESRNKKGALPKGK